MDNFTPLPQPQPHRSVANLLRLVLISSIIPIIVGGVVLFRYSYSALERAQLQSEERRARAAAVEINAYIDDLQRKLAYISRVRGFADLPEEVQRAMLVGLQEHNAAYANFSIIFRGNTHHVFVGHDGNPGDDPYYTNTPFYQRTALDAQDYLSEVYLAHPGDVFDQHIDSLTLDDPEAFPALTMAVPIRGGSNEVAGALVAQIDLSYLRYILNDPSLSNHASGTIYVVDSLGRVVASSTSIPGAQLTDPTAAPAWARERAQFATEHATYVDPETVGATYPVRSTRWTIVVSQPKSVALASLAPVAIVLGVVFVLAVLGVVAVIAYTQRRVVSPLVQLAESVGSFAHGNLSQRVNLHTGDELQLLGDTFNGMAARLQDLLTTLEARVARRTRQLQTAAEVSRAASSLRPLNELLGDVVNLIQEQFGFYHAQVFLVEPGSNNAVLRASTGAVGQQLLARGHALAVGSQSVIGRVTAGGEPVIARANDKDGVHRHNELLPNTVAELAVPIKIGQRIIGALDVQSSVSDAFNDDDVAVLTTLADQIAVAINNAQLFGQVEHALDETSRLFRVSRRLAAARNLHDVYEAIIHSLRQLPIERIVIALLDDTAASPADRSVTVVSLWDKHDRREAGARFTAAQLPQLASPMLEDVFIINDMTNPPENIDPVSVGVMRQLGVRSQVVMPLRAGSTLLGWTLMETLDEVHIFTPSEVGLARATTEQAATVLERMRLFDISQRRVREQAAIATVGRLLTSDLSFDALVNQFASEAMETALHEVLPFDRASIAVHRPKEGAAEIVAFIGEEREHLGAGTLLPLRGSLLGQVIETREPVRRSQDDEEPLYTEEFQLRAAGVKHSLVMPLVAGSNVFGSLNLSRLADRPFTEEDVVRLTPVASQIAIAFQNARLFLQIQQQVADLEQLRSSFLDISAQTDFDELLRLLAERGTRLANGDGSVLFEFDPERDELVQRVAYNVAAATRLERVALGEGVAGRVAQERVPLLINDYQHWEGRIAALGKEQPHSVLSVPLLWRGNLSGVLSVILTEPTKSFGDDEVQRLALFADQAALTIENARLLAETEGRVNELELLRASFLAMGAQRTLDELFTLVIQRSLDLPQAEAAILFVLDRVTGDLVMRGALNLPESLQGARVQMGQGAVGQAALRRELIRVDDYQAWEGRLRDWPVPLPFRAVIAVPLVWRGEVLAVLHASRLTVEQPFNADDERRLLLFADQASVALANMQQQAELQRRAEELAAASEVSRAITHLIQPDELLTQAVDLIRERFGFYHAQVFLVDEAGEWAVLKSSTGEAGRELLHRNHRLAVGSQSVIGYVTAHGQYMLAIAGGPIHRPNPLLPETQAELALPMRVGQRIIGALDVQSTNPHAFQEDDIEILQTMANQLAVAIENAALFNRTEQALRETQTFYEISDRLVRAITPAESARVVIERLLTLGVDYVSIMRRLPDEQLTFEVLDSDGALVQAAEDVFAANSLMPGARITPESYPLLTLFDSEEAMLIADLAGDARVGPRERAVAEAAGVRALAIFPMRTGSRWLGVVVLGHATPHELSPAEVRLVETITDQAAVVFQGQELLETTQRTLDETSALYRVGSAILSAATIHEIGEAVTTHMLPTGANSVTLMTFVTAPDGTLAATRVLANHTPDSEVGQRFVGRSFTTAEFPFFASVDPTEPIIIESVERSPLLDPISRAYYEKIGLGAVVVMPLRVRGRLQGAIQFGWPTPTTVTTSDLARWRAVADQVAVAMQNLDLLAETQSTLEETERLYFASRDLASASQPADIVRAFVSYFHPGSVSMGLLVKYGPIDGSGRPEWVEMVGAWRRDGRQHAFVKNRYEATDASSLGLYTLMAVEQATIVPDVDELDLPPAIIKVYVETLGVRSTLTAPLVVGEERLGAVLLLAPQAHTFHEEDLRAVLTLARQASIVYQNQSLFAATQAALSETKSLYEATRVLNRANNYDEILEAAAPVATPLGAEATNLLLFDAPLAPNEMPTQVRFAAALLPPTLKSLVGQEIDMRSLPFTRYLIADEPISFPDVSTDRRLTPYERDLLLSWHARALVLIPLRVGTRWLGWVSLTNSEPYGVDTSRLGLIVAIADQMAAVIENRQLFEVAERRARRELLINQVTRRLRRSLDPDEVLRVGTEELSRIFEGARTRIWLEDGDEPNGAPATPTTNGH